LAFLFAAFRAEQHPTMRSGLRGLHLHHGGFVDAGYYGVLQGPDGRNAPRPSGQTALADKISGECEAYD
jgi:hypothetical protein